jgi:4-carboxymuconolactone decarboxylase
VKKYTPRQKEVADKHTARRDSIGGPYNVWIHSPELFEKASAISNYMRFDCGLPVKLREFGILVTARYWDAQYSWNAHVDKAIAAGIPEDVVRDLAARKKPNFKADDERVYYNFTMEMLENHFVSEKTFNEARAIFGERTLVDLIGSIGYFSMLQICLNSAEVDLQADRKPPFADVQGIKKDVLTSRRSATDKVMSLRW